MRFLLQTATSPFFLLFITLFFGMCFGKWQKMGKFKLGSSGPLFVGLLISWLVHRWAYGVAADSAYADIAAGVLENGIIYSPVQSIALILFIVTVGLLASKDLIAVVKRYGARFVFMGTLTPTFGAVLAMLICHLLPGCSAFEAVGVLTGSQTSSPGLAIGLETGERVALAAATAAGMDAEAYAAAMMARIGTAYSLAYPFGVTSSIFGMMLLPRLFKIDKAAELKAHRADIAAQSKGVEAPVGKGLDIRALALVCALGYVIGSIKVPLGNNGQVFSLGSTGGMIISAVGLGCLAKLGSLNFRSDPKIISGLRDIAVSSYLGMVGLSYGYDAVQAIATSGVYIVLTALLVAPLSVLFAFLLGRYVLKLNWIPLSGAICGSMTSTPGLAAAVDSAECDDPSAGYAACYPFALCSKVVLIIVMFMVGGVPLQ